MPDTSAIPIPPDARTLARALGDPTRVAILLALAEGERSVGELVTSLGESQPKVSNHLAALRAAGLIASRREHRTVRNALAGEGVAALVAGLAAALGREVQAVAVTPVAPPVEPVANVQLHAPDAPPAPPEDEQLHAPDAPPAPPEDEQLHSSDAAPEPPAGAPATVDRPAGTREFVVFVLGGGEYGLPIADVREIVRYTPPRSMPGTRPGVLGLVQVHGRLLDVVDVRATLGLDADAEPRELVVVEHDGRAVAMPVEAIRQVVSVAPDALREPPDASAAVEVVAALDDRLVLVLRSEAVVGPGA